MRRLQGKKHPQQTARFSVEEKVMKTLRKEVEDIHFAEYGSKILEGKMEEIQQFTE